MVIKKGNFKKGHIPWNKGMVGLHLSPKSEFKKGLIPWNKDKSWSKDMRKKLSETHKGKKRSEEFSRKMSEVLKGNKYCVGRIPWNKGKSASEKERLRLKKMRENNVFPKKDTKIEVKIQNYLEQLGIEFFIHKYIKEIEHGYQCDIFIPSKNMVIECDGDYWHSYPTGREIDHIRTKELVEKGFKVLRLWEKEINLMSLEEFKSKIN